MIRWAPCLLVCSLAIPLVQASGGGIETTPNARASVALVHGDIVRALGRSSFESESSLRAQTPTSTRAQFDVVSVKPNPLSFEEIVRAGVPPGVWNRPGGRLVGAWVTLKDLIAYAYTLKDYQLDGGSDWTRSARFDVDARADEGAGEEAKREMLKTLLAERFQLQVHVESRSRSVDSLSLLRDDGRLGAGIKPTSAECQAQLDAVARGTPLPPVPDRVAIETPVCGYMLPRVSANSGTISFRAGGISMPILVNWISSEPKGPVVDRTALSGNFDIVFEYDSPRADARLGPGREATAPQLRDALRTQLSLKLERGTAPVPITVIDAAQRPIPD